MNDGKRRVVAGVAVVVAAAAVYFVVRPRPRPRPPLPRSALAALPSPRWRIDLPLPAPVPQTAAPPTEVLEPVTLPEPVAAPPPPPLPRYKERLPGEWDGMLVDLATEPPCGGEMPCGLARACIDGVCTACEKDGDCQRGEACVLDHCVRADQVSCRTSQACSNGAKCILSGYSADPRGNAEMTARCVSPHGGSGTASLPPPAAPEVASADAIEKDRLRIVPFEDEMQRARAALPPPEVPR